MANPYPDLTRFPHCDQRVLHAPGECQFCDAYPDWQQLREAWGISYTGHQPQGWQLLPCPADASRPPDSPSDHRSWSGNRAYPEGSAVPAPGSVPHGSEAASAADGSKPWWRFW